MKRIRYWRRLLFLLLAVLLLTGGGALAQAESGGSEAFERCYGDQLTGVSREIYQAMVSQWGSGKTKDITYRLSTPYSFKTSAKNWRTARQYKTITKAIDKAVQSAYDAFIYDYPEVFWLSTMQYYSGVSLEKSDTSVQCTVKTVVMKTVERYSGAKQEVKAFQKAVSRVKNRISKKASSGSRYAIIKEIHQYLCDNVIYGANSSDLSDYAHTAAGVFLKDRVVVCEGYAKSFKILCDEFAIPCVLVAGYAGEPHMWNYVKMDDGRWYLVDVTWDDREDGMSELYLLAGSGSIGYDGGTVGSQHIPYTDFSGANAIDFTLPVLASQGYDESEKHTWKKVSGMAGTCLSYRKVTYRCSHCGLEKTEILDKTDHSWGTYKSDKNATCLKDGTKTASCKYGCGATKTVTDTGSRLKPTISLNVTSVRLQAGQSTTSVRAGNLGKGDSIVSWKSSKTSVVTAVKKGKLGVRISAKKAGKATVTVTLESGLKKSFRVYVQNAKVRTKKITGVAKSMTLKKGKTAQLSPELVPITSQEKLKYASSDKKVVTVTSKGVVQAHKKGTAVITVRSGTVTKKCKVTVK